eukprot:736620_1
MACKQFMANSIQRNFLFICREHGVVPKGMRIRTRVQGKLSFYENRNQRKALNDCERRLRGIGMKLINRRLKGLRRRINGHWEYARIAFQNDDDITLEHLNRFNFDLMQDYITRMIKSCRKLARLGIRYDLRRADLMDIHCDRIFIDEHGYPTAIDIGRRNFIMNHADPEEKMDINDPPSIQIPQQRLAGLHPQIPAIDDGELIQNDPVIQQAVPRKEENRNHDQLIEINQNIQMDLSQIIDLRPRAQTMMKTRRRNKRKRRREAMEASDNTVVHVDQREEQTHEHKRRKISQMRRRIDSEDQEKE